MNDKHRLIQKAERLVRDNPESIPQEQIEKYVAKAKHLLRERTPEELAEMERQRQISWDKWKMESRERNRMYALRLLSKHQEKQHPKRRFFGIKIGWWY